MIQLRALLVPLLFCTAPIVVAQDVRKVALLIGVEEYEKRGFTNLSYAEDDMTALAAKLRDQGFDVTVMLASGQGTSRANRQNVVDAINKRFIPRLKDLRKQDISLVAMAGHGRHQKVIVGNVATEDHFFCPCDAHDTDSKTWISISTLIKEIESESGSERNLILVDACRDNPSRGRGVDGKGMSLNRDAVAVLFASSYNEQAYEPDELRHGLFTHFVLEGLSGAAKNFDNEVTWDSLVDYVKGRVERTSNELRLRNKIAGTQRPNSMGNLRGQSQVLARISSGIRRRPALLKSPFGESEASERITEWAAYKGIQRSRRSTAAGVELGLVPAGEFVMGSEETAEQIMKAFSHLKNLNRDFYTDAEHQHRVEISKRLWFGKTEVTLGQFRQFVEDTGYKTDAEKDGEGGWGYDSQEKKAVGRKPEFHWRNTGFSQDDSHPVVNVSWNDAVAFCNWLSREEGLPEFYEFGGKVENQGGRGYRLPTEAEWEYACRAGTTTRYTSGDDPEGLVRIGNTWDSSTKEAFPAFVNQLTSSDRYPFTSPVGRFRSNSFGLLDMHGNAFEWCQDWYSADYYQTSPVVDPPGPESGSSRVLRGGSWRNYATYCRSAYRYYDDPTDRYGHIGFRVVLSVE